MKKQVQSKAIHLITLVLLFMVGTLNGQAVKKERITCTCSHHSSTCSIETPRSKNEPRSPSNSMGFIQPNTNPVLPSSYNFVEYVYAEPNDQGTCDGSANASAVIDEVFIAQTHRHTIGHPFHFTIGERPALLQVAVLGNGAAPDVQVEGRSNGASLGTLCLNGPSTLSSSIDLTTPNFSDYFSVTIPKSWIQIGLELIITAGDDIQVLDQSDLNIQLPTELNLVVVDMDLMDYNHLPHRTPMFDNFLQEVASALPVSVVRLGEFPEKVRIPVVAANSWQGVPAAVQFDSEVLDSGLDRGNINAAAHAVLGRMQQAAGDFANTIYFGNTLNLDPGGWGIDGNFVGFEFTDVFIHELGHALSLPHWEWEWQVANPEPGENNYPYAGETGSAGGRGEAWNFIQDTYEFVSPYCEDSSGNQGIERSDCMQREHPCIEMRSNGAGPWDGFGDFSAIAINNFLIGSEVQAGQVDYRGGQVDYQLRENTGYPKVTLNNGQRQYSRDASQPQNTFVEDFFSLPGEEQLEQDVYMISGSIQVNDPTMNIIYDPIKYTGTLLTTLDPTDPNTFSVLQNLELEDAPQLYDQERDITLRLTYANGDVNHVLVPFHNSERFDPNNPPGPFGVDYFSVVVPGDQPLCNVELFRRDFIISDAGNPVSGNINDASQNITAANFMDAAVLMAVLDHSCNCPDTPGYVAPGTPCDDGNPYTINDVEDGFCNCVGTQIPICGKINNSEFTQSLAGWRNWGTDVANINDEAAITVQNPGDAGFGYDPIVVVAGESYTLTFEAYSTENRPLNVLHRGDYDFENDQEGPVFLNTTFQLSPTKTLYESSYTVSANGVNTFLEFNLSGNEAQVFIDNVCLELSESTTVPVTFISFSGEVIGDDVDLTWEVTDEINVSHYVIQRSVNSANLDFINLGEVTAEGFDSYSFIDEEPVQGTNHYRIEAVDFDGQKSYTETIVINFDNTNSTQSSIENHLRVYPNPTEGRINLSSGELIEILDTNGKKYAASLDVSHLRSGVYIAIIEFNGNVVSRRFIKI